MDTVQSNKRGPIPDLLKKLRSRLDPTTPMLGEHERLRSRRGKAVSQEEMAEAIGVSRGWYACLESGSKRPSVSIIARLATALNTNPDERATLFQLGIPALNNSLIFAMRCPNCDTHFQ
ncbi:MAG: helix-turn-helix transcriptional regulator [Candidatus Eremiobacteraeota bacterium]|nr:helix-turn-helix transcriptional regulator [Candidatus Eremiobacteraeota bacterium]